MKNILVFLILVGMVCATNQYYFLMDNITRGGPMNNGDCYYIINDSWSTPAILTISDLATILIGQNMSNNYLWNLKDSYSQKAGPRGGIIQKS